MATNVNRTLLTLLGVFAYLGLAILGEGGVHRFFSHPPLSVATLVLLGLSAAALFTEGNLSSGEREDRGNRWVLAVLGVLGILAGFLPAYTDRKGLATLDGDGIRWLGVLLFAAGGGLRIWPVFVLGRRFSGLVAIQPGHRLVTDGVYRIIRHPSYLGLLISSLGWVLLFRSAVGVALTALMIPPLVVRIRAEEKLLRSHFGAEYEGYSSHTARLVPGIF
jgi:protein-S-isoprenylcysteine O-methyltransferase Ste14